MGYKIVLALLLFNGLGIAIIWTKDILWNHEIDLSKGFFRARDANGNTLFWPHWFAEYITAALLIVSPVLVFTGIGLGEKIMPFAAGALFYTALNSLGWAFAEKSRYSYAVPMIFALVVSIIYFVLLLLR
jgi:hypothetical protein